jgi:hypothetical protein
MTPLSRTGGEIELARAENARSDSCNISKRELLALREAAKRVIAEKFSTFKARNGRDVGIEDDSGEKCWIIGHEAIGQLEYILGVDLTPEEIAAQAKADASEAFDAAWNAITGSADKAVMAARGHSMSPERKPAGLERGGGCNRPAGAPTGRELHISSVSWGRWRRSPSPGLIDGRDHCLPSGRAILAFLNRARLSLPALGSLRAVGVSHDAGPKVIATCGRNFSATNGEFGDHVRGGVTEMLPSVELSHAQHVGGNLETVPAKVGTESENERGW